MTIEIYEYKQGKYQASLKDLPGNNFCSNTIPYGHGESAEAAVSDLFWRVVLEPKWIPFITTEYLELNIKKLNADIDPKLEKEKPIFKDGIDRRTISSWSREAIKKKD